MPGIAVYDVKAGKVTRKIDTIVAGNYLRCSLAPTNSTFPRVTTACW